MSLKELSTWSKVLQKHHERKRPVFVMTRNKSKAKIMRPKLSALKWG